MLFRFIVLAVVILGVGCANTTDPSALAEYYQVAPRTIVILPVVNHTTEVEANRLFLATVARPLINRGYYVFPVEATQAILAREGIYEPAEAHNIPPDRLLKYFGADAVLYITIDKWDSTYVVLASRVSVWISYRLVATRSGVTLWQYRARQDVRSGASGSDPIGLLVSAAVNAALTALLTDYIPLATAANHQAFSRLLPGVYHYYYPELQQQIQQWQQQRNSSPKR